MDERLPTQQSIPSKAVRQIALFPPNEKCAQTLNDLENKSYQFSLITSEIELLQEGCRWDLLILDFQSEAHFGLSLISRVNQVNPHLPILVCLSETQLELVQTVLDLGGYDIFFEKEGTTVLPRMIERALDKSRLERELAETKKILKNEIELQEQKEEDRKSLLREVVEHPSLNHRELIKNFSRILSASKNLDLMIPLVLGVLKETFHVSRIGLFLDEFSTGSFVLRDSIGIPEELTKTGPLFAGSGLPAYLMENATILRSKKDLGRDKFTPMAQVQRELHSLFCEIAVPLFCNGKLVGILVCNNKVIGVPLTDADLEFMYSLCSQIAVAVENAHLYSEVNIQNQYLECVLNDVSSAVITIDQEEKIKTFNPKAEEILALSAEEVLFKSFQVLPQPLIEILQLTLREGKSFDRHQIHMPPSGRPFGVSASQVKGKNGEILGCVIVFADLTLIHKQFEWERQQDHLKFVNQVAMRSSHDLKNSLVSIRTFTQLLPDKYADEEFRTNFYSIVNKEVDRLTLLVDNLGFFAQNLEIYRIPCDLNEVMEESFSLIPKDEWQNIVIEKEVMIHQAQTEVDPENMKKVFVNAYRNAIQALPKGGKLMLKAWVEKNKENVDFICVQIEDNGKGMPQEECQRAFEPFFTTRNRGIGLGLTILRQIVQGHGGEVSIESEVDKGTTLFIRIPCKELKQKPSDEISKESRPPYINEKTTENINR